MRNFGLLIGVLSVVAGCSQPTAETIYLEYPIIDFSSQWIEFGEVQYGETEARSFVVQNRGDLPLGVSDIYEGRGQDGNFDIVYDVANIICPDSEADSADTATSKSFAPAPAATIYTTPSSNDGVDFGVVSVDDSSIERVTITNVGDEPLSFTSDAFITPRDNGFSIATGGELSTVELGTGEEHSIFVEYAPLTNGPHSAQLFIISSDPENGQLAIPLNGDTEDRGGTDDSGGATDDTGADDTGNVNEWGDQVKFVLDAGCRIPVDVTFTPVDVGEIYGSVIVETATQQREDEEEPEFWSDIDHDSNIIYLQGSSERTEGRLVVTPRSVDFGHIWAGEEEIRYIQVANAGDGDLTLDHPTLDENCSEAYSISWSYAPNEGDTKVLEGGAKTLLEVSFVPEDQNDAYCTLNVFSDDEDNLEEQVYLQGNSGVDPTNHAPTVAIRSPEPGYVHTSLQPMQFEINVFDRDQPANTLTCRVRSSILASATLASCAASDESGHVFVDVPVDEVDPGSDTIQVLVTDVAGTTSMATIPVLINADYPDSDDDGDGFGSGNEDPELDDCDDNNMATYPNAVEILDGGDNDCDLLIDEGTAGADDDGDTVTELDGDCDDNDEFTLPGAPEAADNKDNDCDGEVDEGTNLSDDDGDGYAEVNNDCNDANPDLHPGATELCDDLDNDCNGRIDDSCIAISSEPLIVGGINMGQTAAEENEQIQLSVFVYDADGQNPSYVWSTEEDAGLVPFDSAAVAFTCPALPSGDARLVQVYAVVEDPDRNQVWDFAEIACYPEGSLYQPYVQIVYTEAEGGCATSNGAAGGMLALAGLGLVALRRRRDDD